MESQFTFSERDVNSARFRKYISYFPHNTGGCHSPYSLPKPIVYPPGILFVSSVSQVPKGKNKVVIPVSTNLQFIFAVLQFLPPNLVPRVFCLNILLHAWCEGKMPWDEVGSSAKINPRDKYFFAQTTKMNPREIVFLQFYMNCSPVKPDFHLKRFIRNSKIGPFYIVVFRAKLKKVEIFSTFFAENWANPIKLLECKISREIIFKWKSGLKLDFHLKIISRESLHSSNLIGFA